MWFSNRRYKKQLKDFLDNLKRDCFTKQYLRHHKHKINALNWILAYYEERTGSDPKTLLESYFKNIRADDNLRHDLEWIKTLYFWVYYKRIEGF